MKKIWMIAALLLCLAVCMIPAFAEGAVIPEGTENGPSGTPVPTEVAGDGDIVPDGVDEPSVDEPSMDELPEEATIWDFEEIKAYINGTVIPAAVMVVTALGALYVALVPVFNKVKLVVAKFNSASDEITATAGESRKTKEQTKATLDKLRGDYEQLHKDYDLMCARYETMAQSVSADMTAMKQELSDKTARVVELSGKMEKMMVVGFCNNRELMEKGYARKIAQIGAGVEVDMSEIAGIGEQEAGNEQDGIEEAS